MVDVESYQCTFWISFFKKSELFSATNSENTELSWVNEKASYTEASGVHVSSMFNFMEKNMPLIWVTWKRVFYVAYWELIMPSWVFFWLLIILEKVRKRVYFFYTGTICLVDMAPTFWWLFLFSYVAASLVKNYFFFPVTIIYQW